jgi:AmmeMemoRadiSam system protein A
MSSLAEGEKESLLHVARRALIAAVTRIPWTEDLPVDPALVRPGGAFVTLFYRGRLRGCIGQLPCDAPLVEVAAHCARAVASEDPRFPALTAEELPAIEIEISVLSELVDIKPEQIEPGKHGLLVSNGSRRGVLLPQVAVQFRWNGIRFLEATCEKAGLPNDAWKSEGTRIQAFTAEVFRKAEFPNE